MKENGFGFADLEDKAVLLEVYGVSCEVSFLVEFWNGFGTVY